MSEKLSDRPQETHHDGVVDGSMSRIFFSENLSMYEGQLSAGGESSSRLTIPASRFLPGSD
jgi:hypothetical protein